VTDAGTGGCGNVKLIDFSNRGFIASRLRAGQETGANRAPAAATTTLFGAGLSSAAIRAAQTARGAGDNHPPRATAIVHHGLSAVRSDMENPGVGGRPGSRRDTRGSVRARKSNLRTLVPQSGRATPKAGMSDCEDGGRFAQPIASNSSMITPLS